MWSRFSRKKTPEDFIGLFLHEAELCLAHLKRDARGQLILKHCRSLEFSQNPAGAQALKKIVSEWHVKGVPCCWVLSPKEYRLLLIDALEVPSEELISAARWRVKDMTDVSIDDAALDVFTLDKSGKTKASKKMYVVVSRISHLQTTVQWFQEAGLNIETIEISELAIGHVLQRLSLPRVAAFLYFKPGNSAIMITHNNELYFTRAIEIDVSTDFSTQTSDALVLEVQRTFDYCSSNLGLSSPTEIFYGGVCPANTHWVEHVQAQLTAPLSAAKFHDVVAFGKGVSSDRMLHCLNAVGGAFRIAPEIPEVAHAKN